MSRGDDVDETSEDLLLINDGFGFFKNETTIRLTPDMYESAFGTALTLSFMPAIGGASSPDTYTFALADEVISATEASTPGDRDFEIRALTGNVVSESGAGPQAVNAPDVGLSGIRGHFAADVSDPANAPFDVNQDGTINAVDMSCVRLTCGVFGNTAP